MKWTFYFIGNSIISAVVSKFFQYRMKFWQYRKKWGLRGKINMCSHFGISFWLRNDIYFGTFRKASFRLACWKFAVRILSGRNYADSHLLYWTQWMSTGGIIIVRWLKTNKFWDFFGQHFWETFFESYFGLEITIILRKSNKMKKKWFENIEKYSKTDYF